VQRDEVAPGELRPARVVVAEEERGRAEPARELHGLRRGARGVRVARGIEVDREAVAEREIARERRNGDGVRRHAETYTAARGTFALHRRPSPLHIALVSIGQTATWSAAHA
jgi:hypothetical protein